MEDIKKGLRASFISAIVNTILSISKIISGIVANSTALIADGIHSLIDVFSSVFVWIGLKISEKPADSDHPYGHYKAENIAEFTVGIAIIITSILIINEALEKIENPTEPKFYAIYVALFSALIAELLARYKIKIGREIGSSALISEGLHSRTDAYSSIAVVLGFIFVKLGYTIADPIVALLISLFILKIGIDVLKESLDVLMDRSIDKKVIEDVEKILKEDFDKFEVFGIGSKRHIILNVKIFVDKNLSIKELEEIEKRIKNKITMKIKGVKLVIISFRTK